MSWYVNYMSVKLFSRKFIYFLFLTILFVFPLLNTVELILYIKFYILLFFTKYYFFHILYVIKKLLLFKITIKYSVTWLYCNVLTIS